VVKESSHAWIAKGGPATPLIPPRTLHLNELWKALADEDRRRALTALSQIVAKQLQPPPRAKEVGNESC
jgi:hypothetical protein